MAKVILKSSFMNKKSHATNLISYISTRDGVELNNIKDNDPATKKQLDLINSITNDFEFIKNSENYKNFEKNKTKKNASIFLSDSIETLESQMMNKEIYMKYISERPGVEKFEEHGLFNQNGFADLKKEIEDIKKHDGIVWANIISLKREDSIETGYDNALAFQKLIASKSREISELLNISYDNFRWNGAFHDEGYHPHIHLICYSENPNEGYLKKENIKKFKGLITQEIFKEQFLNIEKEKDKYRNNIRNKFREIAEKEYSNLDTNNKFILMNSMKSEKRNYYKYQDKKVKNIIRNEVKNIIDNNPSFLDDFSNFKKCEKELAKFYTDKNLDDFENISLENHEEFKSVFRNLILNEITKNKNNLLKDYYDSQSYEKTKKLIERDFFNNSYLRKNEDFIERAKELTNIKNNYYKYQNESLKSWIDEYINKKSDNNFLSNIEKKNLRNFILEELTKIKLDEIRKIKGDLKLDFKNKFNKLHSLDDSFKISKNLIKEISILEKELIKDKSYLNKEKNFLDYRRIEELELNIKEKEEKLKNLKYDLNEHERSSNNEKIILNLEEKLKYDGKNFIEKNINENLKNNFEQFSKFNEFNIKEQLNNLDYELNNLKVKDVVIKLDEFFKLENFNEGYLKKEELNNLSKNLIEKINLKENKLELCAPSSLDEIKKISQIIKKEFDFEDSIINNKFLNSYLENKILQNALSKKKELIINIKSNIEDEFFKNIKDNIFFARKCLGEESKILNEIKLNEKTIKKLEKEESYLSNKKYKRKTLEINRLEKLDEVKEKIRELKKENKQLESITNESKFNPKYELIKELEKSEIKDIKNKLFNKFKDNPFIKIEFEKYKKLLNIPGENFLDDEILKNSIDKKLNKSLESIKSYNQRFHARNESLFLNESIKLLKNENGKLDSNDLRKEIRKITSKVTTLDYNSYFSQSDEVKKDIKKLSKDLIKGNFENTTSFIKDVEEAFNRYKKNSNIRSNIEDDDIFISVVESKIFNLVVEEKKNQLDKALSKEPILNNEILNKINSKYFQLNESFSKDLFNLSRNLKSRSFNIYEFQDENIKKEVGKILNKILKGEYGVLGNNTSKNINEIYKKYLNGNDLRLEENKAFKNLLCNKILENATKIKRDFYTFDDYENEIKGVGKSLCSALSGDLFKMTKEEREGEVKLKAINQKIANQIKRKKKQRPGFSMV